MSARNARLDHLLGVYRVGSGDWAWREEYDNLIDQPDTQKLLARIRAEGIREPVLLGTDGRVWDGHHRIVIAMHLGLDSVPVEFAGEGGALNALIAEKRTEWEAEQGEATAVRLREAESVISAALDHLLVAEGAEFDILNGRKVMDAVEERAGATRMAVETLSTFHVNHAAPDPKETP